MTEDKPLIITLNDDQLKALLDAIKNSDPKVPLVPVDDRERRLEAEIAALRRELEEKEEMLDRVKMHYDALRDAMNRTVAKWTETHPTEPNPLLIAIRTYEETIRAVDPKERKWYYESNERV